MKYKFNLKIQAVFGIMGFLLALLINYLFTSKLDWISAAVIGIANFAISGFYTSYNKCP